jgi:hypothetical protein
MQMYISQLCCAKAYLATLPGSSICVFVVAQRGTPAHGCLATRACSGLTNHASTSADHAKLLLLQAAVDAWTAFIKRCEVLNVNEVRPQPL